MAMTHFADERKRAIKDAEKLKKQQEKDLRNDYDTQIFETGRGYEDAYRENAVQKAINERQVAESMANMGLRDSGLNRTQQTAVQLGYANNNAAIDKAKRQAVDSLNLQKTRDLASLNQNWLAKKESINQTYDNMEKEYAAKVSAARYNGARNNKVYSLTDSEMEKIKTIYEENGSNYNAYQKVCDYLLQKGKPVVSDEASFIVTSVLGIGESPSIGDTNTKTTGVNADGTINWKNADIEMVDDTMNGVLGLGALFGHYDTNDKVKINGTVYETSDVHTLLDDDPYLTDAEKKLFKEKIRDLSEGEVYNFSK